MMKRLSMIKQIGIVAIIITIATTGSMAQSPRGGMGQGYGNRGKEAGPANGAGYFCNNVPDLTEEQKLAIEKIRLEQKKEALTSIAELDAKRVKLTTLIASDNPDKAAIDKLIDEMAAIKANMQKKHAANMIQIRKLLTEEQKVYFDNHTLSKGFGMANGQGRGNGHGQGGNGRCTGMR